MSTEKFTPGPWEVTGANRDFIARVTEDPTDVGSMFASLWGNIDTTRHNQAANAALIAAAPEMYEIIKRLIRWDIDFPVGESTGSGLHELDKIIADGKALLKKARKEF